MAYTKKLINFSPDELLKGKSSFPSAASTCVSLITKIKRVMIII